MVPFEFPTPEIPRILARLCPAYGQKKVCFFQHLTLWCRHLQHRNAVWDLVASLQAVYNQFLCTLSYHYLLILASHGNLLPCIPVGWTPQPWWSLGFLSDCLFCCSVDVLLYREPMGVLEHKLNICSGHEVICSGDLVIWMETSGSALLSKFQMYLQCLLHTPSDKWEIKTFEFPSQLVHCVKENAKDTWKWVPCNPENESKRSQTQCPYGEFRQLFPNCESKNLNKTNILNLQRGNIFCLEGNMCSATCGGSSEEMSICGIPHT